MAVPHSRRTSAAATHRAADLGWNAVVQRTPVAGCRPGIWRCDPVLPLPALGGGALPRGCAGLLAGPRAIAARGVFRRAHLRPVGRRAGIRRLAGALGPAAP